MRPIFSIFFYEQEQQMDILERIHVLNPRAKVIKTQQSRVAMKEILDTKLYKK